MTQTKDSELREIKTALESNTKAITALTQEMRSGFSSIKAQTRSEKISSYDFQQILKSLETMPLRDVAKILVAATEKLTRDYL
jgi:hypothetical protein